VSLCDLPDFTLDCQPTILPCPNASLPPHACTSPCLQRNGASVVKELLSDAGRRSCLKALNRDGATPLHLAVQTGLLDIARLLVNAGAKVDATDRVRGWLSAERSGRGLSVYTGRAL
jgi:hypothetical protein